MDLYIYPIATAATLFPLLSAIFTLPYVINQYHKYGALLLLRIILVYSFIFYLMTSYFMTILPLPPIESVQEGGTQMLLVPFEAVKLWWLNSGLVLSDPATYIPALLSYEFLQIAFNIVLLIPFGVYLRYYFERKWYQVFLLSFLYSLFFELTQLTGLYRIYPHAYRWFEVDDLICNTLGGMVGFLITPICSFFLPTRDQLDEMSYRKGQRVSITRRGLANVIDWGLIVLGFILLKKAMSLLNISNDIIQIFQANTYFYITVYAFVYFVISSVIMSGKTIGKYIVSLQIYGENGEKARFYQYIIRYGILYLIFIPTPIYIVELLRLFKFNHNIWFKVLYSIELSILVCSFLYLIVNILISTILHHSQLIYDQVSRTNQISSIRATSKNKLNEDEVNEDEVNEDQNNENKSNKDKNDKNKINENESNKNESNKNESNENESNEKEAAVTEESDEK